MSKYQQGIIYIIRDRFQLFVPGLPNLLEFRFVSEIVHDLDVENKSLLHDLVKVFIANNGIPKSSLILVIGDSASIIKDFVAPPVVVQPPQDPTKPPPPPQPNIEEAKSRSEEFLQHIPFEEVTSKSIPIPNGIRAYATNKDLVDSIRESFEDEGFEVLWAIPAIALGPEVSTKPLLDSETINIILKKAPTAKEFNLLTQRQPTLLLKSEEKETKEGETPTEKSTETVIKPGNKSEKTKTIILVAIFAILIIVLIVVYLNQPPL